MVWVLAGLTILVSSVPFALSATSVVEEWLGKEDPSEEWKETPYEDVE